MFNLHSPIFEPWSLDQDVSDSHAPETIFIWEQTEVNTLIETIVVGVNPRPDSSHRHSLVDNDSGI